MTVADICPKCRTSTKSPRVAPFGCSPLTHQLDRVDDLTAKLASALTAGPGLIFREADRGPAGNVCLGCGAMLERAHTWAECHAAIKAQSETWLENWLMETTSVDAGMVRGIRAERDALRALARNVTSAWISFRGVLTGSELETAIEALAAAAPKETG